MEKKHTTPTPLVKSIYIDDDKCVNCHACITACPVKYCNDGSGDTVSVNDDMCIACGKCIEACSHEARIYKDDFNEFLNDVEKGVEIIAIVAPSAVSNFQDNYLKLNGWLNKIGVKAIFDVSFGAELTVKSYLDYFKDKSSQTLIAQPCPAIVSYIQLYKPELIKYLAPVDSPMVHTMKMIKEFYKEYKNHKILAVSPCIAKKREFEETGYGNYNVSFNSIERYIRDMNISFKDFEPIDYLNPPAERAVMFSTPGGLLQTAERWFPDLRNNTRKIEGNPLIYDYLESLEKNILAKNAPLLVDCLNCEGGCNAGTMSINKEKSFDEIEYWINKRNKKMQEQYKLKYGPDSKQTNASIHATIEEYWKPGLYNRSYINLWQNINLKYPDEYEIDTIYRRMHKYSKDDIYNCSACGYGSCKMMATAIFNNLNRPENCHFYLSTENEESHKEVKQSQEHLSSILESSRDGFLEINTEGVIKFANPSMRRILKKQDIIGRKFIDLLDEENKKILKNQIKLRDLGKKSSYELSFKDTEGNITYCIASGSPLYDADNKRIGSFAIFSDISELKKAQKDLKNININLENKVKERTAELESKNNLLVSSEEELRQNNEELQTLNENIVEQKQQIEQALKKLQAAQTQLIQSAKMAVLGELIANVAHEVNTPLGAIKASAEETAIAFENNIKILPGLIKQLTSQQFQVFNRMLERSMAQVENLSTREERQHKRALKKTLEENNIPNPTHVAFQFVQIGIKEVMPEEISLIQDAGVDRVLNALYNLAIQYKNNANVLLAANKASRIILALKSYSRTDTTGKMGKVDIKQSLNTVLTIYHNIIKKGIEVVKNVDDIPPVTAHADKLNQVWTNLIQNAIQGMNNKGTLTVTAKNDPVNESVTVSIGDTGTGIPEEIRDKIFTPFFTTKPDGEGSGLGLDIVSKIVEEHGGKIYFSTEKNKGTTFFVSLPINNVNGDE